MTINQNNWNPISISDQGNDADGHMMANRTVLMFDDKLTLIIGGQKLMLSRGAFNDSPDVLPENNFFGSKKT